MTSDALPTLVALILQGGLGLAVFQANPKRASNQCFLLLSLVVAAWLASLFGSFTTNNPDSAAFYIRQASATAALIIAVLNLLRFSITKRQEGWLAILRSSGLWLASALAVAVLCQTQFFLHSARFPEHAARHALPIPIYGFGFAIYVGYFGVASLILIVNYIRDIRATKGGEHAELAFILIGALSTVVLAVLIAVTLRFFIEPSQLIWFAPFRIVLFSLVIAYGIATRRIMEVGFFLRRLMSYVVLTAYLLALYGLIWWLAANALPSSLQTVAHVIAAITVAFAMAPARGLSQSFADRLFVGTRGIDFRATVSKAAAILESVTTLPDLLRRFATTIGEAVGTDSVTIFLESRKGFIRKYSSAGAPRADGQIDISAGNPLVNWLRSHREPLILDELHRIRATASTTAVRLQLEALNVAAALGIFSREHLVGIMLLGSRLSGRIYGSVEQNALQILCGQLAVAIENAELFTEVQNAKIYNEILLQNLTTGVIAADADGGISVFNREAEKITGLDAKATLEKTIRDL